MTIAIYIYRPQSIYPICSWFFRNATLFTFSLNTIANSFFMKNSIKFIDPEHIHTPNSRTLISQVRLERAYGIDIDSSLLKPNVFSLCYVLEFFGDFNSIENHVFRTFVWLRKIELHSDSILKLIKRQGIEWIRSIHASRRVDLSKIAHSSLDENNFTRVYFGPERDQMNAFLANDADFCLFAEFPFQQKVFLMKPFSSKRHLAAPSFGSISTTG